MNDLIKELMKQAGTDSSGKWMGVEHAEKFAELIVRECVNQAHGVADLRGVNDDMVYGADTAAVRIHRYFGVEE